jgi:hypothetical protein
MANPAVAEADAKILNIFFALLKKKIKECLAIYPFLFGHRHDQIRTDLYGLCPQLPQ